MEKIFTSVDSYHEIFTCIIENIAKFQIVTFDASNCKTFALLLKTVIEYFRDNNVYYVIQYIQKTDVEFFNKSEITYYNNNTIIAKTNIDYLIDEVINALNIKLIL